jgi:hypothetical protein
MILGVTKMHCVDGEAQDMVDQVVFTTLHIIPLPTTLRYNSGVSYTNVRFLLC